MTQISKRIPRSPRQAAACRRPIDGLLDTDLFKALADPTRAALVACMAKCARPCSVSEVAECCAVDFSVVSRHLALLQRAGVLEGQKRSRTMYYRVRYQSVCEGLRRLADALEECCPEPSARGGGSCC